MAGTPDYGVKEKTGHSGRDDNILSHTLFICAHR
jgi:hypothetical protein